MSVAESQQSLPEEAAAGNRVLSTSGDALVQPVGIGSACADRLKSASADTFVKMLVIADNIMGMILLGVIAWSLIRTCFLFASSQGIHRYPVQHAIERD